jgi:hypothetical protein
LGVGAAVSYLIDRPTVRWAATTSFSPRYFWPSFILAGNGFLLEEALLVSRYGRDAMSELRHRMIADMKLHGLAPGTQKVYVNPVSRLAGHFHRLPDQLSERELRDYFTYLVETKMAPSRTLRTEIFGVKFLFDKTLQRPRPTLKFLCARPSVLTAIDLCQNRRPRARLRLPVKTREPPFSAYL